MLSFCNLTSQSSAEHASHSAFSQSQVSYKEVVRCADVIVNSAAAAFCVAPPLPSVRRAN
jgi:hypothetical protein